MGCQLEHNTVNNLGIAIMLMSVPTKKSKMSKAMQVTCDDSDDSNDEESDDDSKNIIAFTSSIGFANYFCELVSDT